MSFSRIRDLHLMDSCKYASFGNKINNCKLVFDNPFAHRIQHQSSANLRVQHLSYICLSPLVKARVQVHLPHVV